MEQKQHDLLPRATAIALLLFGAAGFTAYFGSGDKAHPASAADTPLKIRESRSEQPRIASNTSTANSGPADTKEFAPSQPSQVLSNTSAGNIKQRPILPDSSTEAVYYCGAITKKGTPCTRRVKAPGRCWQHTGQVGATSRGS